MKYQQKSFSVNCGGDEQYRANFDAIDWGATRKPDPKPEPTPTKQTIREMVTQFHTVMGIPIGSKPAVPSEHQVTLRLKLIAEEFFELLAACGLRPSSAGGTAEDFVYDAIKDDYDHSQVDIVAVADAFGDLAYVVEGGNLAFGINSEPVLAEVHANNLSKLGLDGVPLRNAVGKVIKPEGWTPPDIAGVLNAQH